MNQFKYNRLVVACALMGCMSLGCSAALAAASAGAPANSQAPATGQLPADQLGVPQSNPQQNNDQTNSSVSTHNAAQDKPEAPDLSAVGTNTDLHQSFSASGQADSSLTLDQRLTRLEQQVTNLINLNKPQQLSSLQNQILQLSGQVEVLEHNLKQLNQQQRNFYQALDQRIDQMKTLHNNSDNAQIYPAIKADQKSALESKESTLHSDKASPETSGQSATPSPTSDDSNL